MLADLSLFFEEADDLDRLEEAEDDDLVDDSLLRASVSPLAWFTLTTLEETLDFTLDDSSLSI